MIMKYHLIFLLSSIFLFENVLAQSTLKLPEMQKELAREKYVLLSDNFNSGRYLDAYQALSWITENAPDMHESVYIMGQKTIKKMIENDIDANGIDLKIKLMNLYDLRIKYFGKEIIVLKKKANDGYKYFRNDPGKLAELLDLYDYLIIQTGGEMNNRLLYSYFNLKCKQRKINELDDESLLSIYWYISEILMKRADQNDKPHEIKKIQKLIDQKLVSLVKLNCENIQKLYAENWDKMNVNQAKLLLKLSVSYGCKNEQYFLDAIKIIYEANPKVKLAKIIAINHLEKKEYDTAIVFFEQSLSLSKDSIEKAEIYFDMAKVYYAQRNKIKARDMAYNSLKYNSEKRECYRLIGDLYYSSFQDCAKRMSRIEDRAVFYAAYEKYKLANNKGKMALAEQQFPTMEEIHQEDFYEGQLIKTKCWMNESVKIRRRPKLASN